MKNNKKMYSAIIIVIILLITIMAIWKIFSPKTEYENLKENNIIEEVNKNEIEYQENTGIEELKQSVGATAENEIYEVAEEYDGRKVLAIKPNIEYSVAFAGIIKKSIPQKEELEEIVSQNKPVEKGIWISNDSREKFLELIRDCTNSKYKIDENGYLRIEEQNEQNKNDEKLEKMINGEKQYVIDISGITYIVDNITGEIQEYPFEKMDPYQTYEYFEFENNIVIVITTDEKQKLTSSEIVESILEL